MAQASSAQREPSMEEILASIRRIIEDSETGQKTNSNAETAGSPAAEVETFRAELKPVSGPVPSENTEPATSARQDAEPTPFTWPHNDVDDGGQMTEEEAEDADQRDPAQAEPARETAPARFDAGAGPRDIARMPTAIGVNSDGEQGVRHQPIAAEQRQMPHARPAMLSPDTGRKVAAAFEELNEVFEAKRAKSLDQVAEEMLRPMLQEWLDNNLPTLVERLVREEIERVARGD